MELNKALSEEKTQTANKHFLKCSTLLAIREPILRFHLIPAKMTAIKNTWERIPGKINTFLLMVEMERSKDTTEVSWIVLCQLDKC